MGINERISSVFKKMCNLTALFTHYKHVVVVVKMREKKKINNASK